MTFDDLPSVWRRENHTQATREVIDATVLQACRRVERLGGEILRRDVIESIAAAAVLFFFGRAALTMENVVARVGAAFLACHALFIIFRLYRARTIRQPTPLDASVLEFCRIELARLERQIELGRSVLWWYIAPGIVGVNLVYFGSVGFGAASLAYGIATLLFAGGVYVFNVRTVARELVPPRDELANLLHRLETNA